LLSELGGAEERRERRKEQRRRTLSCGVARWNVARHAPKLVFPKRRVQKADGAEAKERESEREAEERRREETVMDSSSGGRGARRLNIGLTN